MVTGASTADVALILDRRPQGGARADAPPRVPRDACSASPTSCCASTRWISSAGPRSGSRRSGRSSGSSRSKLEVHDLTFIPVSALHRRQHRHAAASTCPGTRAPSLLHHLEELHVASDRNLIDARMPGAVRHPAAAGRLRTTSVGTPARSPAASSGRATRSWCCRPDSPRHVSAVWGPGGTKLDEAFTGQAVTIELADNLDISRGDMLCRPNNRPTSRAGRRRDGLLDGQRPDAVDRTRRYTLLHTTRDTARPSRSSTTASTSTRCTATRTRRTLALNEIGRIRLRTQQPLHVRSLPPQPRDRQLHPGRRGDQQHRRRRHDHRARRQTSRRSSGTAAPSRASTARREGMTVWLTGLSGSGKSTRGGRGRATPRRGRPAGVHPRRRQPAARSQRRPRFQSRGPRRERPPGRRGGQAARRRRGRRDRRRWSAPTAPTGTRARAAHEAAGLPFVEIFVDTPLEVARRATQGHVRQGARGGDPGFTGVDDAVRGPVRTPNCCSARATATSTELAERMSWNCIETRSLNDTTRGRHSPPVPVPCCCDIRSAGLGSADGK